MKLIRFIPVIFLCYVMTDVHSVFAQAQKAKKDTLGIGLTVISPALEKKTKLRGKDLSLEQLSQSLDSKFMVSMAATRKFQLVNRRDLKQLLKEQDLANSGNVASNDPDSAKIGKISGIKYLVVPEITSFSDITESVKFEGIGRAAERRLVRISCVIKIYDTATGLLLEAADFKGEERGANERKLGIKSSDSLSDFQDILLDKLASSFASRVTFRIIDVIYPAKVIFKKGKQIIINRGDGTGVELGQIWEVMAVGEELKDPDTGEILGQSEVSVGKAKITRITPKTTHAELVEDFGVELGAILHAPEKKNVKKK